MITQYIETPATSLGLSQYRNPSNPPNEEYKRYAAPIENKAKNRNNISWRKNILWGILDK
ncbi:MAG: hypothetical protein AAB781_01865 [Patescibacteria group bacterium]